MHRPWTYLEPTPEAFDELLARSRAPSEEVFLIRRIHDDALVDMAALSQIAPGNFRSAHLGYSAFAPHEGGGT